MGNFILGYGDKALNAVYSGGTWATNLGLSQFTVNYSTAIARTTTDAELTIDVTITDLIEIGCVAVLNHNLTSAATIRWRIYEEIGRTTLIYDSTALTVGNFADELGVKNTITAIPNVSKYYLRLTVNDTSNPDNFLQFGGIFIGTRFQTDCNVDYGLTHGVEDPSNTMYSDHGVEHNIQSPVKRTATFGLSLRTYAEGDRAFRMMLESGTVKRVLYQFDEDDKKDGLYSFLGKLDKLSPLQYPTHNINDMNFSIRELT